MVYPLSARVVKTLYMQAYDCLHIRVDIKSIHVLSILNIEGLSRPKSSRNLSSDRLETKYESCEQK